MFNGVLVVIIFLSHIVKAYNVSIGAIRGFLMAYEWIRRKLELIKLVQTLKDHSQIEFIKKSYLHIKVRFKSTGIIEHWALNDDNKRRLRCYDLPKGPSFFHGDLELRSQFETNPLYPDDCKIIKDHFMIERRRLNQAGWCAKRLKLHEITAKLFRERPIIQYTVPILMDDFEDVLADDLDRYKSSPIRYGTKAIRILPGRRVVDHFNGKIMPWKTMSSLFSIVNMCGSKKYRPLTWERIYRLGGAPGFVPPNFYRSWFRGRIDFNGKKVLDLQPDGSRALAIMLNGGIYSSDKYYEMSKFVDAHPPSEFDKYDVMFLNGVRPRKNTNVHEIIRAHKHLADTLIVCTGKEMLKEMVDAYKPRATLRTNIVEFHNSAMDDYIFIIDQK